VFVFTLKSLPNSQIADDIKRTRILEKKAKQKKAIAKPSKYRQIGTDLQVKDHSQSRNHVDKSLNNFCAQSE
jgi:hypothetical protein